MPQLDLFHTILLVMPFLIFFSFSCIVGMKRQFHDETYFFTLLFSLSYSVPSFLFYFYQFCSHFGILLPLPKCQQILISAGTRLLLLQLGLPEMLVFFFHR